MPLLSQLHILKSSSGKVVKVKENVCAQWGNVATHFIFSPNLIDIIKKDYDKAEEAFDDTMKRWLNGIKGTCHPITWSILLAVLQEIDHKTLATDLETIYFLKSSSQKTDIRV